MRLPGPVLAAAAAAALLAAQSANVFAQVKDNGPTTLVITYKAPAAHRAEFRALMEKTGAGRFVQWQREGVFSDFQILFASYSGQNVGDFDMAVILQFASFADTARWREVDRRMPGGLSRAALALAAPDRTTLAYPVGSGAASKRDPRRAAYVLGLYEVVVDAAAYTQYARGYIEPQLRGWLEEGALTHYAMYQSHPYQSAAQAPWTFLLVLEYADPVALAASDAVKNKVRARLEADAAWKAFSDNKATMRKAKGFVFADAITGP